MHVSVLSRSAPTPSSFVPTSGSQLSLALSGRGLPTSRSSRLTSGQPGHLRMLLDPSSSHHPTANQAAKKHGIIYTLLHDDFRPLLATITRTRHPPKEQRTRREWRLLSKPTLVEEGSGKNQSTVPERKGPEPSSRVWPFVPPSSDPALDNGPSSSSNPAAPRCTRL